MMHANYARDGEWARAVATTAPHIVHRAAYDRMAIFQPASHMVAPWPSIVLGFVSISIWYNVINQFMIQRVFAARDMYHARMGIVLAGYLKIVMPAIVVVPGLILFAKDPNLMFLPWEEIRPQADRGYISLLHTLVPVGLRGMLLAALFGSVQSTVNAVLNSTSTILTLDIYKRLINKNAPDKHYVIFGIWATVAFLVLSIILGCVINQLGSGLFVYVQELYAFFAPPFAAVFLLGILFKRVNGQGAALAVVTGFIFGILMKVYVQVVPNHIEIVEPFGNQAIFNWIFCVIVCAAVSLLTPPPRPEQVSDDLTVNWGRMNLFGGLGNRWYTSVILWWGIFAAIIIALVTAFSGLFS
jgi:SSS family solute:Na+ symporter